MSEADLCAANSLAAARYWAGERAAGASPCASIEYAVAKRSRDDRDFRFPGFAYPRVAIDTASTISKASDQPDHAIQQNPESPFHKWLKSWLCFLIRSRCG